MERESTSSRSASVPGIELISFSTLAWRARPQRAVAPGQRQRRARAADLRAHTPALRAAWQPRPPSPSAAPSSAPAPARSMSSRRALQLLQPPARACTPPCTHRSVLLSLLSPLQFSIHVGQLRRADVRVLPRRPGRGRPAHLATIRLDGDGGGVGERGRCLGGGGSMNAPRPPLRPALCCRPLLQAARHTDCRALPRNYKSISARARDCNFAQRRPAATMHATALD